MKQFKFVTAVVLAGLYCVAYQLFSKESTSYAKPQKEDRLHEGTIRLKKRSNISEKDLLSPGAAPHAKLSEDIVGFDSDVSESKSATDEAATFEPEAKFAEAHDKLKELRKRDNAKINTAEVDNEEDVQRFAETADLQKKSGTSESTLSLSDREPENNISVSRSALHNTAHLEDKSQVNEPPAQTVDGQPANNLGKVRSLILIDADTGRDIIPLTEAAEINLQSLPAKKINVKADTTDDVTSMVYQLNQHKRYRHEQAKPFTLAGKKGLKYNNWKVRSGEYTIIAYPNSVMRSQFSHANNPSSNQPYKVTFRIIDEPTDTKLGFMDETSAQSLNDGAPVDTSESDPEDIKAKFSNLSTQESIHTSQAQTPSLPTKQSPDKASSEINGSLTKQPEDNQVSDEISAVKGGASEIKPSEINDANAVSSSDSLSLQSDQTVSENQPQKDQSIETATLRYKEMKNEIKRSNPAGRITALKLINVNNGSIITYLQSGVTINLASLPTENINIIADYEGNVDEVIFNLNSFNSFNIEKSPPFSLVGKTNNRLNSWTPNLGEQQISAIPVLGIRSKNSKKYYQSNIFGTKYEVTVTFINDPQQAAHDQLTRKHSSQNHSLGLPEYVHSKLSNKKPNRVYWGKEETSEQNDTAPQKTASDDVAETSSQDKHALADIHSDRKQQSRSFDLKREAPAPLSEKEALRAEKRLLRHFRVRNMIKKYKSREEVYDTDDR
jgi:hypothetical protein